MNHKPYDCKVTWECFICKQNRTIREKTLHLILNVNKHLKTMVYNRFDFDFFHQILRSMINEKSLKAVPVTENALKNHTPIQDLNCWTVGYHRSLASTGVIPADTRFSGKANGRNSSPHLPSDHRYRCTSPPYPHHPHFG